MVPPERIGNIWWIYIRGGLWHCQVCGCPLFLLVYAKWTAHPNRASDATYRIYHVDGSTDITVNQRESGGQWYLLGTFTLDEYSQVSLAASATGHVIADALRVEMPSTANGPKQVYYYHNDHLGTPQLLTDQQQSVVWQGRYTPFGEVVELVNLVEQPLRFPGQYHDRETGLYYNYFRDYNPSLGRYLQSDPLGLVDGPNTYAYVRGNPLRHTDSRGLQTELALNVCWTGPHPGCWGAVAVNACKWAIVGGAALLMRGSSQDCTDDDENCNGNEAEDDCAQEIEDCTALCIRAQSDPDLRNVWGGSWAQCMLGCVSWGCMDQLPDR